MDVRIGFELTRLDALGHRLKECLLVPPVSFLHLYLVSLRIMDP